MMIKMKNSCRTSRAGAFSTRRFTSYNFCCEGVAWKLTALRRRCAGAGARDMPRQ